MSDEKQISENSSELTPKEKQILLDVKIASTRKLNAEAEKIETEAKVVSTTLEKAKLDLQLKQLQLEKEVDRKKREEAKDHRNFLYRFNTKVSDVAVLTCMETLTEWHRIDPTCSIEIIFSSPGGSIIDGFELFDFLQDLRSKGHHLTTGTLGYAASMAGILLQAGDVRWVGQQAWVMIHRAAFGAWGKTYEIEDEVKFINRIEERILDIFTSRSNLTARKIKKNWDRKDWWISADEAMDMGLVDEIRAKLPEHKSNES